MADQNQEIDSYLNTLPQGRRKAMLRGVREQVVSHIVRLLTQSRQDAKKVLFPLRLRGFAWDSSDNLFVDPAA